LHRAGDVIGFAVAVDPGGAGRRAQLLADLGGDAGGQRLAAALAPAQGGEHPVRNRVAAERVGCA
jgi:hypothetical protein